MSWIGTHRRRTAPAFSRTRRGGCQNAAFGSLSPLQYACAPGGNPLSRVRCSSFRAGNGSRQHHNLFAACNAHRAIGAEAGDSAASARRRRLRPTFGRLTGAPPPAEAVPEPHGLVPHPTRPTAGGTTSTQERTIRAAAIARDTAAARERCRMRSKKDVH